MYMSKFGKAKEEIHFYRGDEEDGRVVINSPWLFIGRKEKESFFLSALLSSQDIRAFPLVFQLYLTEVFNCLLIFTAF